MSKPHLEFDERIRRQPSWWADTILCVLSLAAMLACVSWWMYGIWNGR